MKNYSSIKACLLIGTIILLISSIIASMAIGYNDRTTDNEMLPETYKFNRYMYQENYDCYNIDEIDNHVEYNNINVSFTNDPLESSQPIDEILSDSPPMESPWPMYCHDVRHTGRSPYSTADNLGIEKWCFNLIEAVKGSPVIDNNGDIYIGASHIFAIYPNGTLKWELDRWIETVSAPAIDEKGVLYVGSIWAMPNYLYAIYTSNGTIKWKYKTGGDDIYSSPAIGDDGTIFFGTGGDYPWYGHINALYPNGTLRWRYETGYEVYSSPTIGDDGTIYCGSHDGYLYALYPNNGTLKWKYKTGDWVGRGPSIADDGTIYFGSWDGYLYAVYPNGTLKWKTGGHLAGTTPISGSDGTIYVGNKKLYAIYPENGTVKWSFNLQNEDIRGSNPCISADGTIYFGTFDGGRIYAVNNDGTEKWHKSIGGDVLSAPAIGKDGTVYIGDGRDDGYLHAFGPLDSDAPSAPEIDGPTSGQAGKKYDFTFKSTSPIDRELYYWIEWGDGKKEEWIGPFSSGEEITKNHTWSEKGTYTIKARAKDTDNLWGPWSEFEITIPRTRVSYNSLFIRFFNRYPFLDNPLNH